MLYAVTRKTLLLAALVAFATSTAFARDDIRTERVHFKPGASSATVKGKIKGYETVDYVLEASKGQQLNVSMSTDNLSSYFNILSPGENEVAMFIGSTSGNQYEGTLPKSGPYKIRVYMMRNAARRDEVANYRLEMIVTGAAKKADKASPAGDDALANDALVEGTDYHATGDIPCAMGADQPTGTCPFGVKREGNGSGMVTVTKPDGRTRTIFFKDGTATGADTSEADPGEFSAEKKDDVSIVRIGDERYEIFDAVIFGG
jgi:hypothetical protein